MVEVQIYETPEKQYNVTIILSPPPNSVLLPHTPHDFQKTCP